MINARQRALPYSVTIFIVYVILLLYSVMLAMLGNARQRALPYSVTIFIIYVILLLYSVMLAMLGNARQCSVMLGNFL